MDENFKLKPIHEEAIEQALSKAERYRLLNEPDQAESICRDILRVHPDHQPALVTIVLALTDQLSNTHASPRARTAREFTERLTDVYQKAYYTGLICERQARALLSRGMGASFAYDGFREAMDLYQEAEKLRPPGNDDAILRWNSCVRTIRRCKLKPRVEEVELLLE
jgi:tetratricopeptide (TPR) repeat protein